MGMYQYFNIFFQGFFHSIFFLKYIFQILRIDVSRNFFFKLIFLNLFFWKGLYYFLHYFCNDSEYIGIVIDIFWFYPMYLLVYSLNIKYHNEIISSYFSSKEKENIAKCSNYIK